MKELAAISAGLVVLATVFWLKVLHASDICREAGGSWLDGDCLFEDRADRVAKPPQR